MYIPVPDAISTAPSRLLMPSIDGIDLQDTTTQQDTNSIATTPNKKERPKSVSRQNE